MMPSPGTTTREMYSRSTFAGTDAPRMSRRAVSPGCCRVTFYLRIYQPENSPNERAIHILLKQAVEKRAALPGRSRPAGARRFESGYLAGEVIPALFLGR